MNKSSFNGSKPIRTFDPVNSKKIMKWIFIGTIVIFVLLILATSYYTVSDKEVAVVTTFGSVTNTTEAGVHFKLPFGIQKIHRVNVEGIHKIELGYVTNEDGSISPIEDESKMISGDFNIVNVDFFIEYKIINAEKYLYSSDNPESVLKMLAQSQIRNVIGSSNVDLVLTDGRENIEIAVKDLIINELQAYDIGVSIYTIKIQDSDPPTDKVRAAFKAVETAKQDSETAENNALSYQEQMMPKADAEADKLLQNAEYLKQSRINQAKEEVALFEAMYEQYILNTEMTKSRMYYETIETILPGVKLYIDTSDGDITKVLPIESFLDLGDK